MGKLLKTGRIVIVLSGRMAGKKGIIISSSETGTSVRPYGHCLVVGVEKAPLKTNKKMGKTKIQKRSRVKPFVRYLNVNHVMATRYTVSSEVDCKSLANDSQMATKEGRIALKKNAKKILQEKFARLHDTEKPGKAVKDLSFLRTKLRF